MFEKAARKKVRFETVRGFITVEDLFDLPLQAIKNPSLDTLAKDLFKQLQEGAVQSFVDDSVGPDETLKLKFEVVLRVIEIKKIERDAAAVVVSNREKKKQLLELIAKKEFDTLAGSDVDELRKMAAAL